MKRIQNRPMPWDQDFHQGSHSDMVFGLLKGRCRPAASGASRPIIGIVGHAGVAHAHSHSGIVQDDSAGFTCVITLLRAALPVDLRIASVVCDPVTGRILLTTQSGGKGEAFPRRGITPQEIDLMNRAVGCDASFCQSLACHVFGRIYGQGVLECAACLEAAAAFAVVDSFRQCWPDHVHLLEFAHDENRDALLGATLEINNQIASLLAVVNFTSGGMGPNEDAEGNIPLGAKKEFMTQLGLVDAPTIIVESKAYIPAYCEGLTKRSLLTRVNRLVDNTGVAQALVDGALKADLPMVSDCDAYPRSNALAESTSKFCDRLRSLALSLANASSAAEKVRLMGELAIMVSQDAGAITFMSEAIHEVFGSAGSIPGTAAVLSMIVPQNEAEYWKIPVLYQRDLSMYLQVILAAMEELMLSRPTTLAG